MVCTLLEGLMKNQNLGVRRYIKNTNLHNIVIYIQESRRHIYPLLWMLKCAIYLVSYHGSETYIHASSTYM